MATILDVEKEKYIEKYKIMKAEYTRFKRDNVQQQGLMEFSVHVEEPIQLYSTVSDFIHQAMVVIETSGIRIGNGEERSFISAIRYIDNLVKHEKQSIDIDELITSTPDLAGYGYNGANVFSFRADVSLESFWRDIPSRIKIQSQNAKQKNQYDLKLKEKKVIDTMEKLKEIVDKYI